jgi:hypothetical protein
VIPWAMVHKHGVRGLLGRISRALGLGTRVVSRWKQV